MTDPILQLDSVTIEYDTDQGPVTAVSDASLEIEDGTFFGLVGESGCGKSTLAQAILGGLDENGQITSGSIRYKDKILDEMSEKELNDEIRWKEIAVIPQSSMNSLDPLERLSDQATKIAKTHTNLEKEEAISNFEDMFEIVGLPRGRIDDYPHQFSGGMQQRAIIALALFLEPSLLIADEPTTALDVIMQDLIFKYLDKIQNDFNTNIVLITHDISLVFESCDEIGIMHAGQIAETGSVVDIFEEPQHPYSILLQQAYPDIRYPQRSLSEIEGHPPQSIGGINRCSFSERCPWGDEECTRSAPPLEPVANNHDVACFKKEQVKRETQN